MKENDYDFWFKKGIRCSQTNLMDFPDKLTRVSYKIIEILRINNFTILDTEYIFEKILAYIKSQNIR